MKRLLISTLLCFQLTLSFGQCDQEVTLLSSKTEYLDGSNVVQRTVDEQSTIQFNKSQIVITPGNRSQQMIGTVQSITCQWSTPYQEGKMVSKAVFDDPSGGKRHATLTTEGKAGKVTFLLEIDEMPDKKIRVSATSFQQTKKD